MFEFPKLPITFPMDPLDLVPDVKPITDVQIGIPAAVIVPAPPKKPVIPTSTK